jgi:hypothetical protein
LGHTEVFGCLAKMPGPAHLEECPEIVNVHGPSDNLLILMRNWIRCGS